MMLNDAEYLANYISPSEKYLHKLFVHLKNWIMLLMLHSLYFFILKLY